MKTLICTVLATMVLGFIAMPARADATRSPEFVAGLVEVFKDCQKIKPGMTRADLMKLQMFEEDLGPLHAVNDKVFRQHTRFQYLNCSLIEVDVDFGKSDSKEAQLTDVITKVSMPYIDARARR